MIGKNPPARFNYWLSALCLAWVLAAPAPMEARDVYFFRDRKGVIHFTDAPTDTRFRPFSVKTRIRVGRRLKRIDNTVLGSYIKSAARKYSLDPSLIRAVIKVESAFDPNAVSWAGAQGLMQLMPGTASLMQVRDPFDPKQNIFGGSRYLRCMLDRFDGDLKLSLAAYNIGPERVAREKKSAQRQGNKDLREVGHALLRPV
jgi:soluble lytic murein transglycosylase